jgi:hypothetical protein
MDSSKNKILILTILDKNNFQFADAMLVERTRFGTLSYDYLSKG